MEKQSIDKNDIIQFFNERAPKWDLSLKKNHEVINKILDNCDIKEGSKVLDVACGTGVLFDFYKERKAEVTGIDISDKMIEVAKKNYPDANLLVADGEAYQSPELLDAVVIYNAFPHFSNPEILIENLMGQLKKNGRFTIAHGLSRERINSIHHDGAIHVSNGLMEIDELQKLVSPYADVIVMISDDQMYQIVGVKK